MVTKGMLRDRAKGMRKQPSRAERALWQVLRDRQTVGAKFRRQHPINSYIADFACVDAKLIVEIDGPSHDSQVDYDAERDAKLGELAWHVLQVRDADVLENAEFVVARIVEMLRERG